MEGSPSYSLDPAVAALRVPFPLISNLDPSLRAADVKDAQDEQQKDLETSVALSASTSNRSTVIEVPGVHVLDQPFQQLSAMTPCIGATQTLQTSPYAAQQAFYSTSYATPINGGTSSYYNFVPQLSYFSANDAYIQPFSQDQAAYQLIHSGFTTFPQEDISVNPYSNVLNSYGTLVPHPQVITPAEHQCTSCAEFSYELTKDSRGYPICPNCQARNAVEAANATVGTPISDHPIMSHPSISSYSHAMPESPPQQNQPMEECVDVPQAPPTTSKRGQQKKSPQTAQRRQGLICSNCKGNSTTLWRRNHLGEPVCKCPALSLPYEYIISLVHADCTTNYTKWIDH
jgi:hypothetical protein